MSDLLRARPLLIAVAAICTMSSGCSAGVRQGNGDLNHFVESYNNQAGLPADDAFQFRSAKLPSERKEDGELYVVYLMGRNWCGSGGCTLMIVRKFGQRFSVESTLPAMLTPISALNSKSNGRVDLSVRQRVVETDSPPEEVLLMYNGIQYTISEAAASSEHRGDRQTLIQDLRK